MQLNLCPTQFASEANPVYIYLLKLITFFLQIYNETFIKEKSSGEHVTSSFATLIYFKIEIKWD